jgi:His-Xaa-Ser system radical SAM maturase HxsC
MLKLATGEITPVGEFNRDKIILRLTTNPSLPSPLRAKNGLLVTHRFDPPPIGFRAYFILQSQRSLVEHFGPTHDLFVLPDDQEYLSDGDVIRFEPNSASLRCLYRRTSPHNAFLVTERCNNYCLMCSQPPRDIDDSYIVNDILECIPLMDANTNEIVITGGEPTLLGDDLVRIIRAARGHLPNTAVHVLTNGRNFSDIQLASKMNSLGHPDLMFGIPLYSDISNIHDYVVQADGAFDETIRGILNLKRCGQKVEIRIVLHKQTYKRLPQLAEFLARNLLFADHVALMGLEMTGFTRTNLNDLWIDPKDYQSQLVEAVMILARYKMNVSIYNHQLCVLDPRLWPFSVKSISDWKNEYMPECDPCTKKNECGGFFSSAKLRYSSHISPILDVGAR